LTSKVLSLAKQKIQRGEKKAGSNKAALDSLLAIAQNNQGNWQKCLILFLCVTCSSYVSKRNDCIALSIAKAIVFLTNSASRGKHTVGL
jgi:hypothetical protein